MRKDKNGNARPIGSMATDYYNYIVIVIIIKDNMETGGPIGSMASDHDPPVISPTPIELSFERELIYM